MKKRIVHSKDDKECDNDLSYSLIFSDCCAVRIECYKCGLDEAVKADELTAWIEKRER